MWPGEAFKRLCDVFSIHERVASGDTTMSIFAYGKVWYLAQDNFLYAGYDFDIEKHFLYSDACFGDKMIRNIIILISIVLLTACAPSLPAEAQPTPEVFVTAALPPTQIPLPTSDVRSVTPTPTTDPSVFAQLFPGANANNTLTRIDQQGEVIVNVTPLNLEMAVKTLEFEVSLETHSVELSMNPANHSTLSTDTGVVVQATAWEGPLGGHHVSGKLFFPATIDGVPVLDGVTRLVIEIKDVDAELRTFEWTLQ
jgi:hypothetical protein